MEYVLALSTHKDFILNAMGQILITLPIFTYIGLCRYVTGSVWNYMSIF